MQVGQRSGWSRGHLEEVASSLGPAFQLWHWQEEEVTQSCWVWMEAVFHWGVGVG